MLNDIHTVPCFAWLSLSILTDEVALLQMFVSSLFKSYKAYIENESKSIIHYSFHPVLKKASKLLSNPNHKMQRGSLEAMKSLRILIANWLKDVRDLLVWFGLTGLRDRTRLILDQIFVNRLLLSNIPCRSWWGLSVVRQDLWISEVTLAKH